MIQSNALCRPLSILAAALLATLTTTLVQAETAPPPPSPIAEAFVCKYNDGKDRDDLLAARDYYAKQAARAKVPLGLAVVLHAFKGVDNADFVWLAFHENLTAFGASTQAEFAAPELASVNDRFAAVATCQSNLGLVYPIFQSRAEVSADPTFIASSACNAHAPMGMGARRDLAGHISGVLSSLDSFKEAFAWAIEPTTGTANSADVYFFVAHDNAAGWAKRTAELVASEGGQRLGRHFDSAMECSRSLWRSERVLGESPPAAQ
ncbi:MAG: hypothetical protein ACR2PZ_10410 [Pseudomonadales bacterium]